MFAMAFSATSASAWTPSGPDNFSGSLTTTLPSGASITCAVSFDVNLDAGVGNTGDVFNTSTATSCVTNVQNCTVNVTLQAFDWTITGVGDGTGAGTVSISGAQFRAQYSGASCSLNGLDLTIGGSVTGDYDGAGNLTFTNATGLTVTASNNTTAVPLGTSVTLNGTVSSANAPQLD